jgi:hypothetical protein
MSNFYATGYQEAFSKLGATRWEQVFRESPEILEGALSAARQGHISGTPSRLKSLESMKNFMGAKDEFLEQARSIAVPDRNKWIQQTKQEQWGNPLRITTDLGNDIKSRRFGMLPVEPDKQDLISEIYQRVRSGSEPGLLQRLFKAPPNQLGLRESFLRELIDNKIGPTPNLPPDRKSNLKRNLLIGGGTLAGLGGATGIALPLALRDKEKTAGEFEKKGFTLTQLIGRTLLGAGIIAAGTSIPLGILHSRRKKRRRLELEKTSFVEEYSDAPSDARISRIRSALGGALTGAGLGVVPAYMGAIHPKPIASIAALGALLGGVGGALFPHRSTESRWGDIFTGEGIPTATSLAGGIGGAALGHKLFKGHMLGRALFGFPGAVLGGFGGSALARKLLESKVPESAPQMERGIGDEYRPNASSFR